MSLSKNFRRAVASAALLGSLALGLASCGDGSREDTLVVGMEMAYPPFEMRGADNRPDGISVRMAESLAESLGKGLRIEDVAWDGIIPALQSGKIDVIISSMTRTEQRARSIDFSDGYVTNGLCMLAGSESTIRSVDDLPESNARVAVKSGTTGHVWATESLEGVELIVLDDASMCALEVAQGKADVFVYDQISIYQHWKRHADKTRAILQPIREETWAIGLRKGEDELRGRVNAWLKGFREAGEFDRLAERYMAEEKRTFDEMGVPFIFH
ncbi:MAG: transporter substrate-binding domain-containing protein [Verrucomicrobiae bacterium]|nr:transporter substrate-binding domain-containing protein [Verrucomicrobiae bacterium]MCP5541393.1 transporter substrate-binding domain-containing protein [Akkermansiaceae bacterium]